MEFTGAIREAKKGAAELVVLAFLDDEPRHGYELTQLIVERSGGALTFNFASLYATLYKLEERKWIQGRWVEKPGQRRRRYYRITAEGREVLAATLAEIVKDTGGPEGVSAFGYSEKDVSGLVDGTLKQERLLAGCPRDVGRPELEAIIRASMRF